MKRHNYLLKSLMLVSILLAIVYGCRKGSSSPVQIKDYAYFEQKLSTDPEMLQLYSTVNKIAFIMTVKIHKTNLDKTFSIRKAIIRNKALNSVRIKSIRTEADYKNSLVSMGYADEANRIVECSKQIINKFLSFKKRNPEFLNLTKSQRVKLISTAMINYWKRPHKLFRTVQVETLDDCGNAWNFALDDATCHLDEGLSYAYDYLDNCSQGMDDGGSAIACNIEYYTLLGYATDGYSTSVSQAEDTYVKCEGY